MLEMPVRVLSETITIQDQELRTLQWPRWLRFCTWADSVSRTTAHWSKEGWGGGMREGKKEKKKDAARSGGGGGGSSAQLINHEFIYNRI